MSAQCLGCKTSKKNVEVAENSSEVGQITAQCPCPVFIRYNDPFSADYEITNCAGLSARLRNKWGSLRVGGTGTYISDIGKRVDVKFTVDGMRNLAGSRLVNRGSDFSSPAPSNPCDIIFVLWVLRAEQWGMRFADKKGTEITRLPPQANEDFHIVAGRLDCKGDIPSLVYSTNGQRPLEGPKPIGDWALVTGSPITNQPDNKEQFLPSSQLSVVGLLPSSVTGRTPYSYSDIPSGSVDLITQSTVVSSETYYRTEFFNNAPTPEVFLIEYEFMETFTSSS